MNVHDTKPKDQSLTSRQDPANNTPHLVSQSTVESAEYEIEFGVDAPRGSMELGKQRNREDGVATEPEKHLTPRATSKEFFFPKSN